MKTFIQRNYKFLLPAIFLGAGAIVFFGEIFKKDSETRSSSETTSPVSSAEPHSTETSTLSETSDGSPSALPMPLLKKMREEVQADPHQVPPSLTHFAQEVGSRMESAHQDAREALKLSQELLEVMRSSSSESVQAYSLSVIRELAALHSGHASLDAILKTAESQASERVLELSNF